MKGRMSQEVGIDIGGTFTDLVMVDEAGHLVAGKTLTTSASPADGASAGLAELLQAEGVAGADVARVVHGTTLAVNLITRRAGAIVGLITTAGFRDALEIARGYRYDAYTPVLDYAEPLVARERRTEVPERTLANGDVLVAPQRDAVVAAVEHLRAQGAEAIAVSFLHAYRNPAHERQVRDWIAEAAPDLEVAISSDVAPEFGEFERTSTVVADAYIRRGVRAYIDELSDALAASGYRRPLYLLSSSGATLLPDMATAAPIKLLESGPAAGVVAAAHFGALSGVGGLVAFDMGGTTAKLSVVENGMPDIVGQLEVARASRLKPGSGIPIRTASVSLLEIGAGGGSIGQVGPGGSLTVGPDSAEAIPGPACYGRGGTQATVTDANFLLGYLTSENFLGGDMSLEREPALAAIDTSIARPLGIDAIQAAAGIRRVVTESMAAALKTHCAERGKDRRKLTLLAYGGAGPMHAALLARAVGIGRVVVPPFCGVLSAFGMLLSPLAQHTMRSYAATLSHVDWHHLDELYAEMESDATEQLLRAGVAPDRISVTRTADMSYAGQDWTVSTRIPVGTLGADSETDIREAFEQTYRRQNHRLLSGREISCKTWRSVVAGPPPTIATPIVDEPRIDRLRPRSTHEAFFVSTSTTEPCSVYRRDDLMVGDRLEGPALVIDRESTVVIEPEDSATIDRYRSVIIDIKLPTRQRT